MVNAVSRIADMIGASEGLAGRLVLLLVPGMLAVGLGLVVPGLQFAGAALMAGLTLIAFCAVIRALLWIRSRAERQSNTQLAVLLGQDAAPCFTTNSIGMIGFQNAAALARFGVRNNVTLNVALQDHFVSPSAVLFRLQSRAEHSGSARDDVVTRHGHTRLSVHRVSLDRYLWRLEEFQSRDPAKRGVETLSLPMLIASKAGVVLFSNEAMRRLLGARPKHLDRVFADTSHHSGEEVAVSTINGTIRAFLAEVDAPGERREIYLITAADRGATGGVTEDFEEVPVALVKFAPDGRLLHANRASRDLVGFELTGTMSVTDMFEGLGRSAVDWLSDVAAGRMPGGSEVLRLRQARDDSFVQVTLRRIVERGRVGVLAVLNDATALKTLEAQFAQSQKMQAIGQLAGGVAHDFNNLLTAISGHCDLLLLRHDRNDAAFADLVQIHQNANRAAALVGQLLAFSRKQTLKPQRLDLQEVLSDLTHLLNRLVGERVSLRLSHAPGLAAIRADKRQLEQVVMNLVVNSRDAMPNGGTIRIETEALTLTEDLRRDRAVVPAGSYAVIRVLDTGSGIEPDRLDKVFEPFYTTKRTGEGTGLGLSMAYGIIKQSGGFIFCDSEVDRGTVFYLYFPIYEGAPEAVVVPDQQAKRTVMRQGEGVVLLVEDEAPVRAFASRALRLRGYTVLEAENGEDALRTLEDPGLEVDLFVTDVVMPGMDGPSWVRIAMEKRPNVRVVFVSGYTEESLSESQAHIPNSVFLPKPFSLNDLTETVRGQLH